MKPRYHCYLAVAYRDGAIVDAWLQGPSAPWEASRRVGDIDGAVFCWSGDSFSDAHKAAISSLAMMEGLERDPFAAVRPYLRDYVVEEIRLSGVPR